MELSRSGANAVAQVCGKRNLPVFHAGRDLRKHDVAVLEARVAFLHIRP